MSEQEEGRGAMERTVSPVRRMSLANGIDYANNMLPLNVFIRLCPADYHLSSLEAPQVWLFMFCGGGNQMAEQLSGVLPHPAAACAGPKRKNQVYWISG